MSRRRRSAVAGEDRLDQVDEAAGHGQQVVVSAAAGLGHRGLDQVPGAVQLVIVGQVAPSGLRHLVVAVQIAVVVLGVGDQLDRRIGRPREVVVGSAGELPADRLQP
jgi:hypothetical protein